MNNKVIISRSKPNYVAIIVSLPLFYFSYVDFTNNNTTYAVVLLIVALLTQVHTVLLLVTPLLVREDETLVVKPKIPFEKKVIWIENIAEVKALSDFSMMIVMKDKTKIKLDMGGYKQKEITEVRRYLQSLLNES